MIFTSILSLVIGIGFASPLFFSDAVRPFPIRELPQGPIADVMLDVAYADFQVQPVNADMVLPNWTRPDKTYYTLSYNVVLNVTNNYDKAAVIDLLYFCASKNYTNDIHYFGNGIMSSGWDARGAWVDGVWYNVTWINGTTVWPRFVFTGNLSSPSNYDTSQPSFNKTIWWLAPYLQEGVHIFDISVNSTIVKTYMDMNGTWVDVTGRINVKRPDAIANSPFTDMMLYPVVSESRFFRTSDNHFEVGYSAMTVTLIGPGKFDNNWAPHETRLIQLKGTRLADSSTLETLNSGSIFLRTQVSHRLANSYINGTLMSTKALNSTLKQVQLQINGSDYLYNNILSPDQMFVPDQYNVQVTVEPRR